MTRNPGPGRYHLLLILDGREAQHGWWGSEKTARRKFRRWVGDWGQPGAHITLTDEDTGETLASWPEPAVSGLA